MVSKKIGYLVCVLLACLAGILSFLSFSASAAQINSTNYGIDSLTLSSGGENASSSNYKNNLLISTISGNASSSNYKQQIGFFYGLKFCGDGSCSGGETCSSCSADCGACPVSPPGDAGPGGGGGGGGAVETGKILFNLDIEIIKFHLKQGETQTKTLKIKNTGSSSVLISISKTLSNLLVGEENFELKSGEEKIITLDFSASSEQTPGIYTDRLIIEGGGVKKIVRIIAEVSSKKAMFDVFVNLNESYRSIKSRITMNVVSNIQIINFGDLKPIDIVIYYAVKDMDGRVISFREETMAINDSLNLTRSLNLPMYTGEGDYIFYSSVDYNGTSALGSDFFKVYGKERIEISFVYWALLALIICLAVFLILAKRRNSNLNKLKRLVKGFEHETEAGNYLIAMEISKEIKKIYSNLPNHEKEEMYLLIKKILTSANH